MGERIKHKETFGIDGYVHYIHCDASFTGQTCQIAHFICTLFYIYSSSTKLIKKFYSSIHSSASCVVFFLKKLNISC